MADRFDKFTVRARRVLTLAQEEAQRLNHNHIDTEHLLLGLLRDSEGVACKVLVNLGVNLSKARAATEYIIGRGQRQRSGDIGLTPQAKKVVELSVEEARRLHHSYIGTEHLLLGLIREGRSIAFGVLESLGVSLERARTEADRILAQTGGESAPAGPTGSVEPAAPSVVAPDAEARELAQERLRASIVALATFSGTGLERGLIDGLLLPCLTSLLRDLFTRTYSASELAEAHQHIRDALRSVASASGAFERSGHADLADHLSGVSVAVTLAVFSQPPRSKDP